jgi:Cu2+-exporting ATPase
VNNQQLQQISDNVTEETDIATIEEWIDRYFTISTVALGSALVGIWIPSLAIASTIILAFLTIPILQRSYEGLMEQHRLKADVVDLIVLPLMILSGYLPAAAFGYWLYYLGLKFMAKAKSSSANKLVNIFNEQLRSVWIQRDGCEIELDFEALQLGDIVVIQGGETIPVDGIIVDGLASIDQRMMTGESQPVEKNSGDLVFAFTIVLTGKIWVKVEKTGTETVASQIDLILNQTTDFAGTVELNAEKMADRLALPTLALGALALPVAGYTSALVVLDSSLVESLYITGTLSVLSHLSVASHHKLLIKDGRALELLKQVDTIVFDKTGTLTQEQPHVGKIYPCEEHTEEEILIYAAIAEYKQNHPIAKAILQAVQKHQITLPTIDDTQYEIGYGVKVCLNNRMIRVGSAKFMALENIFLSAEIETIQTNCHKQGYSLLYVAVDNQLVGVIELHPTIRPEAKQIISQLKQRNLSIYIISGDHEKPTQALAHKLDIDHYFAETFPEDKADLIEQLQKQGKSVCFIGDGINDAIALKKADVSISLYGASTIATDTAQVILMDDSLNQLIKLFDLTDSLKTNFRNSVLWDIVPNIACIGGAFFFHLGIYGALAIYTIGLTGGVINGMLPSIENKKS